ncbi:CIA30 family protein [Burkholderiaceae bacterium DAT-1]|nr:CIA30 family protein [Burkholderiaceae bacterium DAT-1]
MRSTTSSFCSTPRYIAIIVGVIAALGSQSRADTTLIRNVDVFDGNSLHKNRNVLIKDGKIAHDNYKGKTPAGARETGCQPCTLMPGLIDSHVHAFANRDLTLLSGVTTQLDMFMHPDMMTGIKSKMKAGTLTDEADLFSAGILATAPEGHGTEYGFAIPTITAPEQADAFVKARIAEGSDYIKIVYDDGHAYKMEMHTIDKATLKALIDAAHKHGKQAVIHIGSLEGARDAVECGADGLVHLFVDQAADPAFVKLAAEKKVFIVPTWTVYEGFSGRAAGKSLSQAPALEGLLDATQLNVINRSNGADRAAKLDEKMSASIRALNAAGVPILAGTDSGNPGTIPGVSLHREIELLVQGGLTPTQALSAATAGPAKAFHLNDRGRIAKGLKADLLLVKGDPTRNILATRDIVEVWKDGVSKESLRQARLSSIAKTRLEAASRVATPLPADGKMLNIVDGKIVSPFGKGWDISTDVVVGGASTASLSATMDALRVSGEVKAGKSLSWSGAAFYPGSAPYQPADLAAADAIRFKIKGDGKQYTLLAYHKAAGFMPAFTQFKTSTDWEEKIIPFNQLSGFVASEASGFGIVSYGTPGAYQFDIKDVELIKRGS